MHNNRYDVIVIGAGSMGMATGYYLAKQGIQVFPNEFVKIISLTSDVNAFNYTDRKTLVY